MMIDKDLEFADAKALTSSASSGVMDLGAAGSPVAPGAFLYIKMKAAATAEGSATVDFQLRHADAVTGGAGSEALDTPATLFATGAIAKASLTADTVIVKVALPLGLKRYCDIYPVVATGPLTAGSYSAFIAADVQVP